MKRPWIKFYPSDWRSDPKLRMCSLAARGLWIELLGYMHEGEPYGSFPDDIDAIQRLVGGHKTHLKALLNELKTTGTLETKDGRIWSKRLVRDFEKALQDKENGAKGGRQGVNPRVHPEGGAHMLMLDATARKKERKLDGPDKLPLTDPGGTVVALCAPPKFVFQGQIIRLTKDHFNKFQHKFREIPDLRTALEAADDYYTGKPPKDGKWFFPVMKWLERDNEDWKKRNRQSQAGDDWG